MHFIKELIIHKEKTKDCLMGVLYTQLKFKSNILHQNNPKSKYYCKKRWRNYMGDFEAIQKTRSHVLFGLKILSFALSF